MSASEPTPQVSFESVIIETDKAKNNPIDITLVTTDIDVFEHIDKPYLTGIIAFTDTIGSIAAAGIGSGDRVTIKFKSARKESKLIVLIQLIECKYLIDFKFPLITKYLKYSKYHGGILYII